jgi:DNA-binding CsgD family transcriptional regulator
MGTTLIEYNSSFNPIQASSKEVSQSCNFQQVFLLESILNNYADGILVLTKVGQLIYQNQSASEILQPFSTSEAHLPPFLWQVCQAFIETANNLLSYDAIEEAELELDPTAILRIRVRWLVLDPLESPCLLVMLIDSKQTAINLAMTEAKQFGLTPSETKVFSLYRANYSYSEIAEALFISVNTVKKHMKNIHRKRKDGLDDDDDELS